MKVLSIRQPWATLIAKGYKCYEFRSWRTKYRGELYIHASLGIEKEYLERFRSLGIDEYPTGKIIAKVNMTDCIEVTEDFENSLIRENEIIYGASKGRAGFAWKMENVEELNNPIAAKGQLSIWEYKK